MAAGAWLLLAPLALLPLLLMSSSASTAADDPMTGAGPRRLHAPTSRVPELEGQVAAMLLAAVAADMKTVRGTQDRRTKNSGPAAAEARLTQLLLLRLRALMRADSRVFCC